MIYVCVGSSFNTVILHSVQNSKATWFYKSFQIMNIVPCLSFKAIALTAFPLRPELTINFPPQ